MITRSKAREQTRLDKASAAKRAACGILNIPPELRIYIYEHLFRDGNQEIRIRRWPPTSINGWREPALLRTCRQIRVEASNIYYSSNNFLLQPSTADLPHACDWIKLRSTLAQKTSRPFKSLRFFVPQPSWRELGRFVHLARLFRETGLECGESMRPLFQLESSTSGLIRESMMTAVNIGRVARDRGCNADELEDQFLGWMKNMAAGSKKVRKAMRYGPRRSVVGLNWKW